MMYNRFELEERALRAVRPMSEEEHQFFQILAELEDEAAEQPSGARRWLASLFLRVGAWLDPETAQMPLLERRT